MVTEHLGRSSRALVAVALVVSGLAFAVAPVAASTGAPHALSPQCGPKTATHFAAPGVGQSATYAANSAGTVTVLQQSQTTLSVTSVSPATGWKDSIVAATGTTVHVSFQRIGHEEEQERFWARVNSTGTRITIIIQSCT
jgi:hypothetical protein